MPLNLSTPKQINKQATKLEVTDWGVDQRRTELHIAYEYVDDTGRTVEQNLLTLEAQDMIAAITRASEIAGVDVYGPIKQALYEQVEAEEGATGTIE
jgi:hypothetical protein